MSDSCRTGRLRAYLEGMRQADLDKLRRLRRGIALANEKRTVGDPTDDCQVESDRGIAVDMMHALSDEVVRIDDALARLRDGTYGKCAVCDGEIRENRLNAIPFAVTCTTCQEELEAEAKRGKHHPVYPRAESPAAVRV